MLSHHTSLIFCVITTSLVCAGCGDDDSQPPAMDGSVDACLSEPSCPPGARIVPHGDGGVECSPETASCLNFSLCGGGSFSCVEEGSCRRGCADGEFTLPNTMPPPSNGIRWDIGSACGESFQCGGCVDGPATCPENTFPVLNHNDPTSARAEFSCDDGLYRCEACCPSGYQIVDACQDELCFEGYCGLFCELTEDCNGSSLCAIAGTSQSGPRACPPDAERCREGTCGGDDLYCISRCKLDARLVAAFECDPDSCEYLEGSAGWWCEGGDWTDCDTLPTCDDDELQTDVFGLCPEGSECYVRSECGHTIHCQR
ncbi:MAG: hypothetical protein ACI9KE_005920 [Polyangiales bacterium]|jgi:hypothetical protein